MVASAVSFAGIPPVAVLFAPQIVPVVDIFRMLGDFEDHYDIGALDALEDRLARTMTRDAARGVVSDALLLAFGLRRERQDPIRYAPCGSRRGTVDEMQLLTLLGAARRHDVEAASEAAAALQVTPAQPLILLAADIALRLEGAGLTLDLPDQRPVRPARDAGTVMAGRGRQASAGAVRPLDR